MSRRISAKASGPADRLWKSRGTGRLAAKKAIRSDATAA